MGWKAISYPAMCFPRISETLTQCFTAAPQSRHKRLFINDINQGLITITVNWRPPFGHSPPPKRKTHPPCPDTPVSACRSKPRATLQALYESVRPRPPPLTPPARQGWQLPSNQRKGAEEKTLLAYHPRWRSLTHALTHKSHSLNLSAYVRVRTGPFVDWRLYSDGALGF